jgi:hypothetical protein
LGFTGGLFIVPLAAALQHIPPPESKGAVQGAANLLSWIGIFLASAVQEVLKNTLGLTSGHIFWVCGAAALGTGIYAVATRREALRQLWQTLTER